MDTARWQRILTIVDTALPLPSDERTHYVTHICGEDAALRTAVHALLEAIDASEGFWEEWQAWNEGVMGEVLSAAPMEAAAPDRTPQTVGAWRVVEPLGRGGMGAVYRAERADGLYEQPAALKWMHRGLPGESVRRFDQERQILARLDHPNIARLYDGGVTEDGRPWLAMEFVDGVSITDWCRQHDAPLNQRLDLFTQVCEAVRYAHRNLIVHRDLKPDNILVSETDGRVRVKVLDFGIAKLLDDAPSPEERVRTRTGMRVMSLDYAAPEQIAGDPVTTATDVYTLGLLLYELLAEAYPFDLAGKNVRQIERVLREEEPPRPSARRRSAREDAPDRTAWPQALRGDLDAITLKALRKEPEQRYESAGHLLDDIGRYRNHEVVHARRDSLRYRIGKFTRRHRRALVVSAMVLLGFVGLTAYYTLQLADERNQARLEADRAEQVSVFLEDLFNASDPFLAADTERPDTLNVRHFLERGAARIQHELRNQPDVQSRMLHVVGNVYRSLGLYDDAAPLLEEALKTERRANGTAHPTVAALLHSRGDVLHQKGAYDAAEKSYREALKIYRRAGANERAASARTRTGLALVLRDQGRFDEAEQLLREALAIQRTHLGPAHADVAESLDGLGNVYHLRADLEAAEAVYRESLALHEKLWGKTHPNYARALLNLATLLREKGAHEEAEPLMREALDVRVNVLGAEHPLTATASYELAMLLRDVGRLDQAASLFRQIIALDEKLLGPDHHYVGLDKYELGITLNKMHDFEAAERAYREALDILRNALPAPHPTVAHVLNGLGYNYVTNGAPERGEPFLREALDIYREALGDSTWRTGAAMSALGHALMEQQHPDAESLLVGGYDVLRRSDGPVRAALERLVQLYERRGDDARAETYRERLEEASY